MYRKEALGDNWLKNDRLMLNYEGNLYAPSIFEDWLDKVLKRAELEHVALHSLRHTNITLQLIAGVDLKTVPQEQGMLEHQQLQIYTLIMLKTVIFKPATY